jgi:hypothetical protein
VSSGISDRYLIEQHRTVLTDQREADHSNIAAPLALRLRLAARRDRIADVVVNGTPTRWRAVADSVGEPRIEITAPPAARYDVTVRWAGNAIETSKRSADRFIRVKQGRMEWLQPPQSAARPAAAASLTGLSPVEVSGARCESVDLTSVFNDRVTQIFRNEYRAPRSPFVSLALPKQGIGGWAGGVNKTASVDDSGLRAAANAAGGRIVLPNGVPLATPPEAAAKNIVFASQWKNYPAETSVALSGHARGVYLLLAGSTDPMQTHFENGEIVVTYTDGTTAVLPLINPLNWWPIDQDYFIDDFQFRRPEPLPIRIDLKTGRVRVPAVPAFKGGGRTVPGGAATVLSIPLDSRKSLRSLTVRATANDVVIGLMAATLVR